MIDYCADQRKSGERAVALHLLDGSPGARVIWKNKANFRLVVGSFKCQVSRNHYRRYVDDFTLQTSHLRLSGPNAPNKANLSLPAVARAGQPKLTDYSLK